MNLPNEHLNELPNESPDESLGLLRTIGLVLQVTLYRDYDKILTLFTPLQGLLKIFVKGSRQIHLRQHPYTTLFAKGEYIYRSDKGLSRLHDGTLLSSHLNLRNSLESLQAGFIVTQALLRTQSLGKPAPQLFALCVAYLDKLSDSPETLMISFLLKILKHEGLLQKEALCSLCQKHLESTWRLGGECFCNNHTPKKALAFSYEEERSLLFLSEGRSLTEIMKFSFEKEFISKIQQLFEGAIDD